ncbi:FkbM family methyltransferase [Thiorhodovibrio litoralis]|uniref:FkbM family methyltransferase n=1 Tax=Thiorhodovibrio litoralis TaxID=2952932 RepID=UPI002B2624CD|nr:FkbM family methyltransferase [Thiorhodovibrio litoralis]
MRLASRVDSSSLLALGAQQKALFGMDESGALPVAIQRLDTCLTSPLARPYLLKIDVQGFELEVLKGATALLPEIDAVDVEASDLELYQGQPLRAEIEQFLLDAGFHVSGHFNAQFHQGQRIQADWLFRRA